MIVTAIGMENEVGKIAGMLMNSGKETTPLQNKLAADFKRSACFA